MGRLHSILGRWRGVALLDIGLRLQRGEAALDRPRIARELDFDTPAVGLCGASHLALHAGLNAVAAGKRVIGAQVDDCESDRQEGRLAVERLPWAGAPRIERGSGWRGQRSSE